jgi:DNA-binding NtrC family response regulator
MLPSRPHDENPTSGPGHRLAVGRVVLLLVDDDPLIADSLEFVLRERFEVHVATTRVEAKHRLRALTNPPELALVDLGLPPDPHEPDEGFRLVTELLAMYPKMKVLVLSGQSERANIQHALSLGAADFIPKPCDPNLLMARLEHQLLMLEAERDARASVTVEAGALIGSSEAMRTLNVVVERYTNTPFPVLIEGESGTGKELVAQLLHQLSDRAESAFVSINCASLTPELLEATLFGHAKGAFTGAVQANEGFFESAGDGTLFLDEIGEFPLELQPRLLRVLENGDFYRVGETRVRTSKARVLAATNRSLLEEIRTGGFRHDLFHRLSVLSVVVPPLRERGNDRAELFEHFQVMYAASVSRFELDESARQRWLEYTFPGNVRELRNIVIRLGAKYPGEVVDLTRLEPELDSRSDLDVATMSNLTGGNFRLDAVLDQWEQRYIAAALKLSRGNLSEAARLLGVNRTTLYSKIQRLSLGVGDDERG